VNSYRYRATSGDPQCGTVRAPSDVKPGDTIEALPGLVVSHRRESTGINVLPVLVMVVAGKGEF